MFVKCGYCCWYIGFWINKTIFQLSVQSYIFNKKWAFICKKPRIYINCYEFRRIKSNGSLTFHGLTVVKVLLFNNKLYIQWRLKALKICLTNLMITLRTLGLCEVQLGALNIRNKTANCKIKWFFLVAFRSLNTTTIKISEPKKMLCPVQNLESNDFTNLTLIRWKLIMTIHKIDLKQKITRNKCKENLKEIFQKITFYTYLFHTYINSLCVSSSPANISNNLHISFSSGSVLIHKIRFSIDPGSYVE
jgi:hypothetical protein